MRKLRNSFHFLYLVFDVLILMLSFYAYYIWRYNQEVWYYIFIPSRWASLNFAVFSEYTSIFLLWLVLSIFSLHRFSLFTTNRGLSIIKESWLVFKALLYATVPTAAAVFMLQYKLYSRLVFVFSWFTALFFLLLWRAGKRIYIRYRIKKGLGVLRVLVIGSGSVGETVLKEMKNHPYLGFEIVGLLSQEKQSGEEVFGKKVLGDYNDFEKVIRKYYIDEVFVSVTLTPQEIEKFVLVCRELKCGIKIVPEGFKHIYGDFNTYNMGYIHFLEYGFRRLHGTELFIKRLFDIVGSAFLLFVLGPIFIVFSLLIKFQDRGPVIYVSERVGKKGVLFNFLKFRSMIIDAEKMKETLRDKSEVTGPVFKMKEDPRITSIGKFMRKYSIDELPQLWNVLRGDMSLVGPRPPLPDEVEKYDLWQMRRLEVSPGITCLWQVKGRSDTEFYKWVEWDLWYIDNWSFGLDIKILLATIPAVLKGEGAY